MSRKRIPVQTGPLKGYSVIGHDRGYPCPHCKKFTYCNDCRCCESCGYVPQPS